MAVRFADASPRSVAGFSPTTGPAVGLVAGAAAAALVAARFIDPQQADAGPVICPFRLATGLPCPGCGLTRSWVHLLHGQVGEAMTANPFGIVALTFAVVVLGAAVSAGVRRQALPTFAQLSGGRSRRWLLLGVTTGWVVFGVGRMLATLL